MILQLRYSIYKPSLQSDPLQEILYSLLTACDNLGALNKVGSPRAKTKPALKSFDLITALLDTWNNIPVVARPQHVRGHQDDRIGPFDIFGKFERSNERCTRTYTIKTWSIFWQIILESFIFDEQRVHTDLAWHSFRKARKECSFPMQKFISKWLSGDTATGLVMKRRKQHLHAHCPRCDEDDEHLLHMS
jgi:hypothetical protein